ncbi:unnamed protein product [Arctogadus glacialis]
MGKPRPFDTPYHHGNMAQEIKQYRTSPSRDIPAISSLHRFMQNFTCGKNPVRAPLETKAHAVDSRSTLAERHAIIRRSPGARDGNAIIGRSPGAWERHHQGEPWSTATPSSGGAIEHGNAAIRMSPAAWERRHQDEPRSIGKLSSGGALEHRNAIIRSMGAPSSGWALVRGNAIIKRAARKIAEA